MFPISSIIVQAYCSVFTANAMLKDFFNGLGVAFHPWGQFHGPFVAIGVHLFSASYSNDNTTKDQLLIMALLHEKVAER